MPKHRHFKPFGLSHLASSCFQKDTGVTQVTQPHVLANMRHPKQHLVTDLILLKLHEVKIIPKVPRSAGHGNTPFGNSPDGPLFPKMDHVAAACSPEFREAAQLSQPVSCYLT